MNTRLMEINARKNGTFYVLFAFRSSDHHFQKSLTWVQKKTCSYEFISQVNRQLVQIIQKQLIFPRPYSYEWKTW